MRILKAISDTIVSYPLNFRCKTAPTEISDYELRMHPRLARRLVDKQKWNYIRLRDRSQIPLINAIDYLAEINDRKSIERLRLLFYIYSEPKEPGKSSQLFKGILTSEYIQITIQYSTAKSLIKLMDEEEGFALAAKIISGSADLHLSRVTVELFEDYFNKIIDNKHPNQKPPRFARR
jgi:hypothetical protein